MPGLTHSPFAISSPRGTVATSENRRLSTNPNAPLPRPAFAGVHVLVPEGLQVGDQVGEVLRG